MESKYKSLLEQALNPVNKLHLRPCGGGLIIGPIWIQGLWVSKTIIEQWKIEGWM